MGVTDARGNPTSITSSPAQELFERGMVEFQSYFGDPVETAEQALEVDPEFIMAHLLRAHVLCTLGEAQFLPGITASVEAAERLAPRANDRERQLTAAVRRWADGDWHGAVQQWEKVLTRYPRDALALQTAHLADFLRGDSINLRDRIARVLPHWCEQVPGYSYVLGMQSFGYEECNQYQIAEETGRKALAIEPRDPWAVHAVAHVFEMQNRYDEGIEWFRSREQDWAPDNGFAFHNWWHLALYHIERKEYAQALQIWDTEISPEPSDIAMTLLDATAFLWRLYLNNVDVGKRWQAIADKWSEKMTLESGYYPFNDMHAIMAMIAAGRAAEAKKLSDRLTRAAGRTGSISNEMAREVGAPVASALVSFADGRYSDTVTRLSAVRHVANRFGGSHAQRDIINQTLLEAAIRAGDTGRATSLVNERLAHKPQSPLAWRYLARLHRAAGNASDASDTERKADSFVYPRDAA